MKMLPTARSADIVVQELDGELLIYDLITNKAYSLNETSALVYRACGTDSDASELKTRYNLTDEMIFLAVDELQKQNLVAMDGKSNSAFAGMSRREVIRRAGLGSMVALPIIASLVAPTAAMAQSGAVTCSSVACSCAPGENPGIGNFCSDLNADCPAGCGGACQVSNCSFPGGEGAIVCTGNCTEGAIG